MKLADEALIQELRRPYTENVNGRRISCDCDFHKAKRFRDRTAYQLTHPYLAIPETPILTGKDIGHGRKRKLVNPELRGEYPTPRRLS